MKISHDAAQKLVDELQPGTRLHISNTHRLVFKCLHKNKDTMRMSFGKPVGLWYDVDGDWTKWCTSEEMGWLRPYIYEIILDKSGLLKINDIDKFEKFEKDFQAEKQEDHFGFTLPPSCDGLFSKIDWHKVMKEYGAIEIAPYLWKKRLTSMFYYGWDCASGCVWDEKILTIKPYAYYEDDSFHRMTDEEKMPFHDKKRKVKV